MRKAPATDGTARRAVHQARRQGRGVAYAASYVAFKTLYWRAIAEGHEDEAERLLEENKDIIDTVKRQQHAKAGS